MPTSTDEQQAQAEEHRRSGEAAEDATRWPDAIAAYEQCLSLVAQAEDRAGQDEAALLTALGRCYWNLSEARTAWRTLRRAITLCQERSDGVGQARATVEILRIWGPPERHRMLAEDALERLGDGDPYLRARLLLGLNWNLDEEQRALYDEAMAIADEHGFEDLQAIRTQDAAWQATREGRLDDALPFFIAAHETYARLRVHDPAAGTLRGAAFNFIQFGRLDEGYDLARRSFEYASSVHHNFTAQLALMDMAGVVFARGEFERCEEVLALAPTDSDFRADFYRMWMAERRSDVEGALQLMVNPDRAGGAPTAVGQVHAAAAGLLFRAGRTDGAEAALREWAGVPRSTQDRDAYWMEAPALLEALLALGDDALVRTVYDALTDGLERTKLAQFTTLQGRALAPLRGGICLRLGLLDEAETHYRDGLAWCERERCAHDADLCRQGLEAVAKAR